MTQPPAFPPGPPPGPPPGLPPGPPPGHPAYPPGQPPRRRGLSNVARFWIGVLLCVPAIVVIGFLETLPTWFGHRLGLPGAASSISTLLLNLLLLAAVVYGLVKEATRFIVVGIMAGLAILFVLAAGACVVLLTGLGQSS